uniref:Cytoplasmic dynein 2 light intermediate chain 1 n=1 Tax=Steinernema glaseri TaxID=37863 RepID=A0A1I7ZSY8_9BILA
MFDIWSLAKERLQSAKQRLPDSEREEDRGRPHEAHVVMCGNKSCGKTTLVQRLLEVNENPRPTVALEYTFGRSVRNSVKELGHFWELGGGALLANLLSVPLSTKTIEVASLVIVLDLSRPELLWSTMEALLKAATRRVDEVLRELNRTNPSEHDLLFQRAAQRVGTHRVGPSFVSVFFDQVYGNAQSK